MTWDQVKSNWKQVAGSFREQFGRLTPEEAEPLSGEKERLVEKVQEKYGYSKESAERQVEDWRESFDGERSIPTSTSGAPTY